MNFPSGPGRPDRFSDPIPHFAKDGTALTQDQRASFARRKGRCVQCGMKTHTISLFNRTPVTDHSVYKGTCIKCKPSSVPAHILQKYEHQHPRVSAPIVRASTSATRQPRIRKVEQRNPPGIPPVPGCKTSVKMEPPKKYANINGVVKLNPAHPAYKPRIREVEQEAVLHHRAPGRGPPMITIGTSTGEVFPLAANDIKTVEDLKKKLQKPAESQLCNKLCLLQDLYWTTVLKSSYPDNCSTSILY